MIRRESSSSYRELSEDVEHQIISSVETVEEQIGEEEQEDVNSAILPGGHLQRIRFLEKSNGNSSDPLKTGIIVISKSSGSQKNYGRRHNSPKAATNGNSPSIRFSKSCLKNVFSVILLFLYLLLMAVAVFLVYQTIADFREKLKHPVMSVSYKEVLSYDAPGIALYPGKAELLTCKHHYYDYIPPLVNPGQPGEIECLTQTVTYTDPFTNVTKVLDLAILGMDVPKLTIVKNRRPFIFRVFPHWPLNRIWKWIKKHAVIVEGPRDVKKRELVFMQFHLNETDEDFSAIGYLLFSSFQDFLSSPNKPEFMKACESSYSSWKFSGGFRTWVKMSLVKTKEEDGQETVEFRQEISVVNYIDRRTKASGDQLFFVVFEWKDPFIQEVQDIVTANPWNMIALLCGIFLALFKAAHFAKLSVKWMIKIRKRHLKRRTQVLNHIS